MTGFHTGRLVLAALFLSAPASADPAFQAQSADGEVVASLPMPQGQEICLHWAHSVTGGKVADCFENRDDHLTLTRSYMHDFAAGLGEVEGRGTLTPAQQGGYWIGDIDEALPGNRLKLRTGSSAVGHRLVAGNHVVPLPLQSALALILTHPN